MIQINIKKQNVITNSAKFSSQKEADQWLNQEIQNGSFGKPERWVREDQEDVSNSIDMRIVEDVPAIPEVLDENDEVIQEAVPAVTHIECLLEAEYVVEQEDVTEELVIENRVSDAKSYLANTDWYVIRELDSGIPMPQEIKIKRQEARLKI